ncbi:zinc finger C2H2 domain-containing protein [Candidatus Nitrososphaera gargensis Ga9.2]|uniref:Zinc finger C2H2 domain-containing protein n=1 Tax=Nitrososphaera gargensis (strain Ga9.2) TaxID=1237085 RepID=K0IL53_NITGG|nr:zinc finger C2H2 domain-containing protein [Candidatus Nitrososphaera gargensis Ga9.2]
MALLDDVEFRIKAETIYFCQQCKTKFLFVHDAASHAEMFGHKRMSELPMG